MKIIKIETIALGHKEIHVVDYSDALGLTKRKTIDTKQIIDYLSANGVNPGSITMEQYIHELLVECNELLLQLIIEDDEKIKGIR